VTPSWSFTRIRVVDLGQRTGPAALELAEPARHLPFEVAVGTPEVAHRAGPDHV
jgi:hypothetical protein